MSRILVIDDEKAIRNTLKEVLEYEKHEVDLAEDGPKGLEMFSSNSYDIVLCDIKMAKMDGIEVLTAILGKDRQIPVILNTAYPQYQKNFMTWGAEAYLIKSCAFTELKQKIREVLEKRKKLIKS